ncbi:hypothetical protein E4T44_14625 [Aureobasidium sp. EXF-8845]|nr:hypothetical protein E4T45_14492 [Aureobasidium sp. EXF-8846]KAI4764845.1 hypothetical protein E4T44_14625 [Aureobasidium sp. EXF-8845]
MILGRPRIINAKDCDLDLPLDCPFPDDPTQTLPRSTDEHTPSPLSLLLFRYTIARKFHEIREYGLDKRNADFNAVWNFHHELYNLLDDLPPCLNPIDPARYLDSILSYLPLQREVASSQLNLVIMELHRPFIATYPDSRDAAMKAAIGSINNQKVLMELSGRHHYSYFGFGFFTTNAAMMLAAIALIYPDRGLVNLIEPKVKQALSFLVNIQDANIVARAAVPVIERLYNKILDALPNNLLDLEDISNSKPASTRRDGLISMTSSLTNPFAAPISTEFMLENAGDLAIEDFTGSAAWNDIPEVNDFGATFWLDQLNKLPENISLDEVVGQDMTW